MHDLTAMINLCDQNDQEICSLSTTEQYGKLSVRQQQVLEREDVVQTNPIRICQETAVDGEHCSNTHQNLKAESDLLPICLLGQNG